MHVGTFTPEGTWAAAARELPHLKDLGVTCVEVMPVCEFAGTFGWGYDGVDLFAPTRLYGTPDDFRAVRRPRPRAGLGVILDVVYNHLGPDGNYLKAVRRALLHQEAQDRLGRRAQLRRRGRRAGPRVLHRQRPLLDRGVPPGRLPLRRDADDRTTTSPRAHPGRDHPRPRAQAAGKRQIYLINENEPQHTRLVRPPEHGGYGMDALWNDDFHHSAMVALSGHNEAYYTDYPGQPQEFISAAKWGYLFQGQRYRWQKQRRGTPALDLPPTRVRPLHPEPRPDRQLRPRLARAPAQSARGRYKAMTALLLLMPQTPMLFQGQEFAASSTFHYFADHNPELAKLICAGRGGEMSQFPSVATPEMQACLLDPTDPDTFVRSKLDWSERDRPFHAEVLRLHTRPAPAASRGAGLPPSDSASSVGRGGDVDGAVARPGRVRPAVLRRGPRRADDRLLLVNFGTDLPPRALPPSRSLRPAAGTGGGRCNGERRPPLRRLRRRAAGHRERRLVPARPLRHRARAAPRKRRRC